MVNFSQENTLNSTVHDNEMNTSLPGTIDNYVYRSFQGNIIIDKETPVARTLIIPSKIQSNKCNDKNVDHYIASLKNEIGSLKSKIIILRQELYGDKQFDKLSFPKIMYVNSLSPKRLTRIKFTTYKT